MIVFAAILLIGSLPHVPLVGEAHPSFSCQRAKTGAERAICRDRQAARLDAAIARRYRLLMARLDPASRKVLRAEQRYFLSNRDRSYDLYSRADGPSGDISAAEAERWHMLMARHEAFLNRIIARRIPGFAGIWESSSGRIELRPLTLGRMTVTIRSYIGRCEARVIGQMRRKALIATDNGADPLILEVGRSGGTLRLNDVSMGRRRLCNQGFSMDGAYLPVASDTIDAKTT